MNTIKNYLFKWYHRIRGSIGFYPSMIAFLLSMLAMLLLAVETPDLTRYMKEKVGVLIINNADTARSLLSTLIGGVISLTVFSFSMVMILLNQASSNYSPRLLPGLISNKPHQVVLGFYIGTILFNIICLINVLPGDGPFEIPAFTILLGILLGPVCLILFVYFIHSISQAIQIDNVLRRLHRDTGYALDDLEEELDNETIDADGEPMLENEVVIKSREYGHLISISQEELVRLACENDVFIKLAQPLGVTILRNDKLLYLDRTVDEELADALLQCLYFERQERVIDSHYFGFKQLTEIVIRAMSPGINDPGTALAGLDNITDLLARRMKLREDMIFKDEQAVPRLAVHIMRFDELVYRTFSAIRTYVAHDPVIVRKILTAIKHLKQITPAKKSYLDVLTAEKEALWWDAKEQIKNQHDLDRIEAVL